MATAWMNPTLRAWLVAMRPWSFPASLVPVALAGALIHKQPHAVDGTPVSLLSLNYVLCFVAVLCLHAAGNLTNTYYDFTSGVDKPETADDRALVDKTVTTKTVFNSAIALFAVAAASISHLALNADPSIFQQSVVLVVAAFAMTFFYTANPLSLKGKGLGDLVIFLMFGPMLVSGVSLACQGSISQDLIFLSLPIGLLTVAILNANNARDVEDDRDAGLSTVAMWLGKTGAYCYHSTLMLASYALVVYKAVADDNCMMWMPLLCVPWALYVSRRFHAGLFHELPQRIAQHNLMFGTLLVSAVSDRAFFVRVLLCNLYYLVSVLGVLLLFTSDAFCPFCVPRKLSSHHDIPTHHCRAA